MEDDLFGTLQWQRLRKILLDSLGGLGAQGLDLEERTALLAFMSEHWCHQVPRQNEFATFEQTLRREVRDIQSRLEHEIRKREDVADTLTYEKVEL